jgi:hypothetical protein
MLRAGFVRTVDGMAHDPKPSGNPSPEDEPPTVVVIDDPPVPDAGGDESEAG